MTVEADVQSGSAVVVDLAISEEWTIFDPRDPADEVAVLAQFGVVTDLVDRYAAPDRQSDYHRAQDLARVAFDSLGVAGVSILGTWGRLVLNGDKVEPLAGWFTVAVRQTPGRPVPQLGAERDALIAEAAAAEPAPGQAVLVSAGEVELPAGPALCVVWETRPPEGAEGPLGLRTTEYRVPIGSAALVALTCSCPLSDFADTWDEVFRSVADAMSPREAGPDDIVEFAAGEQAVAD